MMYGSPYGQEIRAFLASCGNGRGARIPKKGRGRRPPSCLAQRLKTTRCAQGLSMPALAQMGGISSYTVHKIEHGGNASKKIIAKLASALQCTVEFLCGEDTPKPKESGHE